MDLTVLLQIAKEYGPLIALFSVYVYWQSRQIEKLLDRHEKAYSGEIHRMAKHMDRLLDHAIGGPRASSADAPTVAQLNGPMTEQSNPQDPKRGESS